MSTQEIDHTGQNSLLLHQRMTKVILSRLQGTHIQRNTKQTLQMKGRVKICLSCAADDLRPRFDWKLDTVLSINILPGMNVGRFRIEDQPIEVKE
jgi:hypothetical protein